MMGRLGHNLCHLTGLSLKTLVLLPSTRASSEVGELRQGPGGAVGKWLVGGVLGDGTPGGKSAVSVITLCRSCSWCQRDPRGARLRGAEAEAEKQELSRAIWNSPTNSPALAKHWKRVCLRTTANSFLLVTFPSLEGRASSAGKGGGRVSKQYQLPIWGTGGGGGHMWRGREAACWL